MDDVIRDACIDLERYSPELAAGFSSAVGVIGLTGTGSPRSANVSAHYFGGLFVRFTENVPALVEAFIHEYYHTRLYMWWLLEAPRDLPPLSRMIESPMTGLDRPVSTMMHALVIYVGISEYYRSVLDGGVFDDEVRAAVRARNSHICARVPELIRRLEAALSDAPQSARLVSFAARRAAEEGLLEPFVTLV